MLPIGGLFTALFILKKWGITDFISELNVGMDKKILNPLVVKSLFMIAAIVTGFILLNEIIAKLTGSSIVG